MVIVGIIVTAIAGIVGMALLATLPVWLIWNNVLVDVFTTINTITFWQALWLSVLASCLFKSSNANWSKNN